MNGALPILLATLLGTLALAQGLLLDDWFFIQFIQAPEAGTPPHWDLYRMIPTDPAARQSWLEAGWIPWWTQPDLQLGFFRPLSSLLMTAEVLSGAPAWAWTLHSLFWRLLFLGAGCGLIYTLVQESVARRWAVWLFCMENAHFAAVGWWSNRHALIGATFALAALATLFHAQRTNWRPGRWLSPFLWIVALLSSELSLCAGGFIIAWAVWGPTPRREALGWVAPHIGLTVLYGLGYGFFERGVTGSSFYLDPLQQPLTFLLAAPTRWLSLWADLCWQVPAEISFLGGPWTQGLVLLGALGVALTGWLIRQNTGQTWLFIGASFALLPAISAPASSRQLLIAGLGFILILASTQTTVTGLRQRLVTGLLWCHLLVPIGIGVTQWAGQRSLANASLEAAEGLGHCESSPEIWILNAPDHVIGFYLPIIATQAHQAPRQPVRTLTIGHAGLRFKRDGDLLSLQTEQPLLQGVVARFWRTSAPEPVTIGETRFQPGPTGLDIQSPHLSSGQLCLLAWQHGVLSPIQPSSKWQTIEPSVGPSGL